MKKIEIRPNGTKRVYTENTQPSKTDQQWKKSCDVNEIVTKYKRTGQLSHVRSQQATYQDVSEIPDLLTSLTQVQKAKDAFLTVPAELRKKLDNDPVNFIEYLNDPKNDSEAIKYGLKNKPTPTPAPVPDVPIKNEPNEKK